MDICNLNVQDFQLFLAIQRQLMLLDIANWYFTSHYSHYKYFCNSATSVISVIVNIYSTQNLVDHNLQLGGYQSNIWLLY